MKFESYATPHLMGTVHYAPGGRLRPDGDTFHLREPRLLLGGRVLRPKDGALEVTMPGQTRPRRLELTDGEPPYLTIRLSGLDAPEAHYVAPVRPEPTRPAYETRASRRFEVCQPGWNDATRFLIGTLVRARHAIVELDRDLTDQRGRVLGFVYTSNQQAQKKRFLSLELLRQGFAFPFVFESAGDYRARFLKAGATARRLGLGVWRRYYDKPLRYATLRTTPQARTTTRPAPGPAARASTIPWCSVASSKPVSSRASACRRPSRSTTSSTTKPATSSPAIATTKSP